MDNISENTQSAESRIRDTDMAEEMVEYSKNNILAQAGQSMLAPYQNREHEALQHVAELLQEYQMLLQNLADQGADRETSCAASCCKDFS